MLFRRFLACCPATLALILYIVDSTLAQALDDFTPGDDYPTYNEVPKGLSFTCDDKPPGYYADPETQCQVWHWCVPSIGGNVMYSFICGPGTVFNQRTRVCDWFFKVDCQSSPAFYSVNDDLYKDEAGNYIVGRKSFTSKNERKSRKIRQQRRKRHEKDKKHNVIPLNDSEVISNVDTTTIKEYIDDNSTASNTVKVFDDDVTTEKAKLDITTVRNTENTTKHLENVILQERNITLEEHKENITERVIQDKTEDIQAKPSTVYFRQKYLPKRRLHLAKEKMRRRLKDEEINLLVLKLQHKRKVKSVTEKAVESSSVESVEIINASTQPTVDVETEIKNVSRSSE